MAEAIVGGPWTMIEILSVLMSVLALGVSLVTLRLVLRTQRELHASLGTYRR